MHNNIIISSYKLSCKFIGSSKAFSLVELMLVLAITAIISAIAIPNYKDYVNRAKVSLMFSTIDPCQTQIYQYFLKNGSLPDGATAGQAINCQGQSLVVNVASALNDKISTIYSYDSVNMFSQFAITHADLHPSASTALYKIYIRLNASTGDIIYSCGRFASNAIPASYMPNTCTGPNI